MAQRQPEAVRRKAQLAKELAAANAGGALTKPDQVQQTPTSVLTTNPNNQSLNDGTVQQQQLETAAPAQETPGGMAPSKIPQDDYKARFDNLRQSRNLDRLKVAELEQENANLKAAAQAEAAKNAPSPLALSDEEKASMSEADIAAHERLAAKLKDVLPVSQEPAAQPAAQSQHELESEFFNEMDSLVNGWQNINESPVFIDWLKADDGFSGRTRQETLLQARTSLDSATAVRIFTAFISEREQATASQATSQNELGNQHVAATVEPGRGSAQANPMTGGSETVILTNADVQEFYRQKNQLTRRRKMVGEVKQQFDAQEAIIRRAHAEGRIV